MAVRPLRSILAKQTALVVFTPFLIMAVAVAGLLYPAVKEDIGLHQQQIAVSVASRIESYLDSSITAVRAITFIHTDDAGNRQQLQQALDALVAASESLDLLYITNKGGKVEAVSLKNKNEAQRQDLLNIDISRNPLFSQLSGNSRLIWSDTFLSIIGGELTVALAAPANHKVVVGEIQLDRLSHYLGKIGNLGDEEIYLLDRHGNIIADHAGRYTGRQMNLSNLPLVRQAIEQQRIGSGIIDFFDRKMIGCYVPIENIGWGILVAQPVNQAYHSLWTTIGSIAGGGIAALIAGILLSLRMARNLAGRFEQLAQHARQISEGASNVQWPESSIAEITELTDDLQHMADTIGERERQLATLMRNIPGMVYRCNNDRQWTVTFASEGCLLLTGHEPADLIQNAKCCFADLIHKEDRDRVWDEVQNALARHEPYTIQYRIITAGNEEKTVMEHGLGIFDHKGELTAMEGVITDISDRVRLEVQLRQSQKMESIGQLAGGVAHDFNNMLTAIIGSAEIIMSGLGEDNKLSGFARTIIRAATKSADLTRKLLLFSRKAPHDMKQIDLHHLLEETINILERSIDKRIKIVTDLKAADAGIVGDAGLLENVFLNMMLNARDAMPDGGELHIGTKLCLTDECFAQQVGFSAVPGKCIEITISDTGTGMEPDVLEHIFEPFFTTKEVGKGTGLGLAAAYGTIKEHGGAIKVYSEPGLGSTFRVFLPLGDAAERITNVAVPAQIPSGKTVLLVDDEELLLKLGEAMLRDMGIDVLLAANGREGVEIFAERYREIDLVLLDVVMPVVNGRDAYRMMKEIDPNMKALFLSGYTRDASVEDLMAEKSVVGFVQKPYRVQDMAQALSKAFACEREEVSA